MVAEFQTGSEGGMVQITWDGDAQMLDLYSPQPGIYSAVLEPKLDWRRADLTRKVLVGGALIADFLGLAAIVTAIFLLLYKYFSGQKINDPAARTALPLPGAGRCTAICRHQN